MPVIRPETFQKLCASRDRLRDAIEPAPSIKDVAREAALSPFHFIRMFTALFGETPHQLRTRARMERAKELLALGNDDVTEVCFDVGFTSLGSFSDLFARRVGVAPSVFRRAVRMEMTSPDALPASMTPGCLTLMSMTKTIGPESPQFSRSAKAPSAARLRTRSKALPCRQGNS
ncbi:MAG: AraC family transcriptional regulator [Vicinamibacteria bacterium]